MAKGMIDPIFWDYLIFDDNADIKGISDDAPAQAKKAYEEWKAEKEKLKAQNIKI